MSSCFAAPHAQTTPSQALPFPCSLVILAGGKSRRMGRDKADLMLQGKSFLQWQLEKAAELNINDILISGYRGSTSLPIPGMTSGDEATSPDLSSACDCIRTVMDRFPDKGPLGGLEASLRCARHDWCLVLSVDAPLLPSKVLCDLAAAAMRTRQRAVILQTKTHQHPLIGIYHTNLADEMLTEISTRKGSVFALLNRIGFDVLQTENLPDQFININDPRDYQAAAEYCNDLSPLLTRHQITTVYRNHSGSTETKCYLQEHTLDVYVSGMKIGSYTCIPQHLQELVLGSLLTTGIIHAKEEVLSLSFDPTSSRCDLVLSGDRPDPGKTRPMTPVTPIAYRAEEIFLLADAFADGMPLHMQTWSTHSCLLYSDGEICFACEDIGRHNAIDKAVGYALQNGIDLHRSILYSSGRIPQDMAAKAIMAGVPILCAKGSPTDQAIQMAHDYDLTLICRTRCDSYEIF